VTLLFFYFYFSLKLLTFYYYETDFVRWGKSKCGACQIKNKIIDAALLLLQKDSKYGFAEKSAVG